MESTKILALLLVYMLSYNTASSTILESQCGRCHKPHPRSHRTPGIVPPVTVPKLPLPPITVPKLPIPTVPILPPILNPPKGKACPPPAGPSATCPADTLKLGACVDLLGGLVHIGLGDPAVNECCPLLEGLVELEAAVCLCTTLKLKALNLNIYVPLALELLITCGKTPPPGYTCSL